jgi:hypothetical protein
VDEPESELDVPQFMAAVLAVAAGLAVYGAYCLVQSPRVREEAERVPRMTCGELVQQGPGADRYVTLTDACLSGGKSVGQSDSDTGAPELYHPLFAAHHQQEPAPRDLLLLVGIMDELERRRIRDDRHLRQAQGQPGLSPFTGEVQKAAAHLPPWARRRLADAYPGMPLGSSWVLIVGRYEPTAHRADDHLRHGIGALLVAGAMGLGWGIWRRFSKRSAAQRSSCQQSVLDEPGREHGSGVQAFFPAGTNRISTRCLRAAAIRRSIAREWPS